MKKNNKIICLLALIVLITSCNNGKKKKPKVTIAMVNWVECIADTHLAKVVLEQKGYDVELINADVAPVFAAVAKGDADLFMEVWEPITHKPYLKKFGDRLEHLGTIYTDGRLGLVVPSYSPINSIDELNQHKADFNGQIIGINPGAGIMTITRKVIKDYKLDYELVTSSEAGMLASLKKAIDQKKDIVVTGWKPHTMFARYDLKILKDPKGTMGSSETISTVATKGWAEAHPKLATFFRNFKMSDQNLGSLMLAIKASPGQEDQAALKWYKKHKQLVDSWFKGK